MKSYFKIFSILGFVYFFYFVVQADVIWNLIKQEDNIRVYSNKHPNTFIETVKGEVIIDAPLDRVLEIFNDISNCPNWMYRCKNARTLKQINLIERIDYIVINFPWPTWDRDIIIHSLFQQDKNTNNVEVMFKSLSGKIAKKPNLVRVDDMSAIMRFIPQKDGSTHFSYEISIDPRGKIPSWMINAMAADYPFYTLKNVRALAEK